MKRTLILVLLTTIVGLLGSVPNTATGSGRHGGVVGLAGPAIVSSSSPPNQPLTPANTSFTYQGSMKDGANPANGQYDFQFKLYDALTGGNQVGPLLTFTNQTVTNGLFTLALNFGTGAFTGDARWLEVAVRVANSGNYTTLSPRQTLTATPYASSLVPGSTVSGASPGAILTTLNSSTGPALMGVGSGGYGLYGSSSDSAGLYATSTYSSAISAQNSSIYFAALNATNSGGGSGVAGYSSQGAGVYGNGAGGSGWGVYGISAGTGVYGQGATGVWGVSSSSNGVYGSASSLYGAGVSGYSNGSYGFGVYAQSENGPGLYATSTYSYGVQALNNNGNAALYGKNLGSGMGVAGYSESGTGVYGQGPANGTWGFSSTGNGVYGLSSSGYGVSGQSTSGSGVYASSSSSSGNGVYAVNTSSTGGTGVYGGSGGTNGYGLYGSSIGASGTGIYASSTGPSSYGVYASSTGSNGYGVYASNTASNGYGVYATSNGPAISGTSVGSDGVRGYSTNGFGVLGNSTTQNGVVGTSGSADGVWAFSSSSYAGYFSGDVRITGSCCGMSEGTTRIDDPLDPAGKYLNQSVVASPDMLEVYRGHVTLDADGSADVQLPTYFEALNRDFDYQLTPVGAPMPDLYVAQEVQGNTFKIAGGKPGSKVSWQVTGVRQDPYAQAHPVQPEQDKPADEKGKYLHPQELGKPVSQGVDYDKVQRLQQSQQPPSGR